MVSLLVRFSWCPFSSLPISLLPSLRCVGSPLLRQVFLGVSLRLLVAGWLPVCACFVSLPCFCGSLLFGVFPAPFFSVVVFSCSISIQLLLAYKFPLIYCAFFHFVGARLWEVPSPPPSGLQLRSSAPLRPLRLASSSIPYGPLCPWDAVSCPLPYRLLCIEPVVMVLVHSLPYRTLFLL